MNFEGNDRTEEWFLIVGEWFRQTHRRWFYALALVLLMAIPLQMFLKLVFKEALISSVRPIKVNYVEVVKADLEVIDTKVFDQGNGTYSGFAKIKNSNSEWGTPAQEYHYEFKSSMGSSINSGTGRTYILPSSEKIIVFPRFTSAAVPAKVEVSLQKTEFIRTPALPIIDLEIQRKLLDAQNTQSIVSAVIINRSPFKITRVDLPVLLFDGSNKIIDANYTNINDLTSNESRSFQYTWHNRINNVSRIEVIPELNPYNREIFGSIEGQDPFDDRE